MTTNGREPDWSTLSGDLRDVMLTHLRSLEKPWVKLSEDRQREIAHALDRGAQDIVRRAVAVIANRGFAHVHVTVGKMVLDKGVVKFDSVATQTETNVIALMGRQNAPALIVLADPNDFVGEHAPPQVDPDQPDLVDDARRLPPPDDWPIAEAGDE